MKKMKKMKIIKIDFISDIHVDFWIKELSVCDKFNSQITEFVSDIMKPKDGDVLVIAGDLGHYYIQDTAVLLELKKHYNRIVLVTGNHDLYLVSKKLQSKYKCNSINRVEEMKLFCIQHNIDYLDGTTTDVNGFIIGGVGMWYNTPKQSDIEYWVETMNDSNLIMEGSAPHTVCYGYGAKLTVPTFDTQSRYLQEVEKLKSLENIDVLVTHMSPSLISRDLLPLEFQNKAVDSFYMSDNAKIVEKINPKVVIFGHLHCPLEFEQNKITYVCNPLGYKHQNIKTEISQIEIYKEK